MAPEIGCPAVVWRAELASASAYRIPRGISRQCLHRDELRMLAGAVGTMMDEFDAETECIAQVEMGHDPRTAAETRNHQNSRRLRHSVRPAAPAMPIASSRPGCSRCAPKSKIADFRDPQRPRRPRWPCHSTAFDGSRTCAVPTGSSTTSLGSKALFKSAGAYPRGLQITRVPFTT
jgi:hypothetical protein